MSSNHLIPLLAAILLSWSTHAQSPREGWIHFSADSSLYVSPVEIFNSSEVSGYTPVADKDYFYSYFLGNCHEPNTINGAYGLLDEWAKQNRTLENHMDRYNFYVAQIDQPDITLNKLASFYVDAKLLNLSSLRFYYLLMLDYARMKYPGVFAGYQANGSYRYALTKVAAQTIRLERRFAELSKQYLEVLKAKGFQVRIEDQYFWWKNNGVGIFSKQIEYFNGLSSQKKYANLFDNLSISWDRAKAKSPNLKIFEAHSARFGTDEKRAQFFLTTSKAFAPDAYAILSQYENYTEFTHYASDTSIHSLLGDFGTVVHESCHGINGETIFVSRDIRIERKRNETFNSEEIANMIPEEIRNKIFRYKTYLGKGEDNTSHTWGIYGLIDEFSAYYQDLLVDYQLLQSKDQLMKAYPDLKNVHLLSEGQTESYYEFSIFMAWYMKYAKLHYPKDYDAIVNNTPFRVTYTLLDQLFGELVKNIDKDQSRNEFLAKLLEENKSWLEPLRVPNCTAANYKDSLSNEGTRPKAKS